MSRAKIIEHYLQQLNDKNFEIYNVRKELEQNNVDEEEIKVIVRVVDNELQRRLSRRRSNSPFNEMIWIGLIITGIGLGITIATYTGIIDMGNSFLIVYGPFFGGLSIFLTGLARRGRVS